VTGEPVPVPDADTQPFWDAAERRRLVVPRCRACRFWIWQPKPVCPRCHADSPTWEPVGGVARVVSWTVLHPPLLPAFAEHAPFAVLLVEIMFDGTATGVRMLGPLVDETGTPVRTDGRELSIGAQVVVRWRVQDDVVVPAWGLT